MFLPEYKPQLLHDKRTPQESDWILQYVQFLTGERIAILLTNVVFVVFFSSERLVGLSEGKST